MDPIALSPAEIAATLPELPGWLYQHNALTKHFRFVSFRAAMTFMQRASFLAENLEHHPLWTNMYDVVTVQLSTHGAGHRVTARDVELARLFEKLSRELVKQD